jgi:hypothetical protein
MGRNRASTAKSEADRVVQTHVANAERALRAALRVCKQARRGTGTVEARRAPRVERDIARALSALAGVGRLTPIYDLDDPDLIPEETRAEMARLAADQRREARRQAEREEAERLEREAAEEAAELEATGAD